MKSQFDFSKIFRGKLQTQDEVRDVRDELESHLRKTILFDHLKERNYSRLSAEIVERGFVWEFFLLISIENRNPTNNDIILRPINAEIFRY